MPRLPFPFTDEMNEHIQDQMNKGLKCTAIYNKWPKAWDHLDKPSKEAIRSRIYRIEQYGVEGCDWTRVGAKKYDWTEEIENLIILAYNECSGEVEEAIKLMQECNIFGSQDPAIQSLKSRITMLQQTGKMDAVHEGKRHPIFDWKALNEASEFTVENLPDIIYYHTPLKLRCSFGHLFTRKAMYVIKHRGCPVCNSFNRHYDPLAPGIFYVIIPIEFSLNDFKLGKTLASRGIEIRAKDGKGFGTHEVRHKIHKPIGEVEDFEWEMKQKYKKWCSNNPHFIGNGSTECFDLIKLPDLEKDIKKWLK